MNSKFRRAAVLAAAATLALPGATLAGGKASAPGQNKAAGGAANGHAYGHSKSPAKTQATPQRASRSHSAPNGNAYGHSRSQSAPQPAPAPQGNAYGHSRSSPAPAPQSAPAPRGKAHGHSKARRSRGGEAKEKSNNGVPHEKVTICHRTGSATNPYVRITVSIRAREAHENHQHHHGLGGDIFPAGDEACPSGFEFPGLNPGLDPGKDTLDDEDETAKGGKDDTGSQLPGKGDVLAERDASEVTTTETDTTTGDDTDTSTGGEEGGSEEGGVLGGSTPGGGESAGGETGTTGGDGSAGPTGGDGSADSAAGASAGSDREAGTTVAGTQLPFTGLELFVVVLAGLALLLTGVAMHRVAGRRSS